MNKLFLLAALTFMAIVLQAQHYELKSPKGSLEVAIEVNQGIQVTLKKHDLLAVKLNNISLEF